MNSNNFQKLVFTLIILPLYIIVKLWQFTRPIRESLGFGKCRFYPSCSDYFLEAVQLQGLLKGSFLSCKRLLKCNPLFKGGVDQVQH